MKHPCVYILSNQRRTTLYVGVTNNLNRRMVEHLNNLPGSFTKRYNLSVLLWYEPWPDIAQAIQRESQIKNWKRQWKLDLVQETNPELLDLWDDGR